MKFEFSNKKRKIVSSFNGREEKKLKFLSCVFQNAKAMNIENLKQ